MQTLFGRLQGARATDLALMLGSALVAWGIWQHDVFAAYGFARARDALIYATLACLAAWLLRFPLRLEFVRSLGLVLALVHALMLGLPTVLATTLVALSGLALGSLLVPARSIRESLVALLVGCALLAAAIGWLLPIGVHRFAIYASAALLLVVWRRAELRQALAPFLGALREPCRLSWEAVLALLVIGYCATSAWLPTAQYDDLVYHLGLPAQLVEHGRYRFDPDSVAWALSPWAADVLQAAAQILAQAEARGAVDTLWFLAALALIWQMLAAAGVAAGWRWLAVALFASQPMSHALLHSMQTELPTAAVVLACAALLIDPGLVPDARRRLLVLAVLGGFLLAMKVSTLAFLLPLAAWLLGTLRPLRATSAALALLLQVAVGGASYVYAWLISGNPVLPLLNDVFQSPDFPVTPVVDVRFEGLVAWTAPFDLVIDSDRFSEGMDGAGGFQWLAGFLVLLLGIGDRRVRLLLLAGLGACLLLFLQMQYLRYLYPALALCTVVLAQLLAPETGRRWRRWLVLGLVLANVVAMSNTVWTVRDPPLAVWARYRDATPTEYLRRVAPERLQIAHLRERHGRHFSVLMLGEVTPFGAEAAGQGFVNSWHDRQLHARLAAAATDASGGAYLALFEELGLTHVSLHPQAAAGELVELLARNADLELRVGDAELYRLRRPSVPLEGLPLPGTTLAAPLAIDVPTLPDGPMALELEAGMLCSPRGAALSMHIEWDGVSILHDHQVCAGDQRLRLDSNVLIARPGAVQIWIDPGRTPLQLTVERFEVRVRPDLGARRDRRARLRLDL